MPQARLLLGIDVGSTTAKVAVVGENHELLFAEYRRHYAEQANCVRDLLALVGERFPAAEFKVAAGRSITSAGAAASSQRPISSPC